jgi:hypothetical protein
MPGVWIWNVVVHILAADRNRPDLEEARSGSSRDRHGRERLAQAYRDMNIRDDG